jgi:hypothetical protein
LPAPLLVSATAYGIGAAVETPRTLMSPVDYTVAKKMIEVKTHEAVAQCRDQESRLRDICKAEARRRRARSQGGAGRSVPRTNRGSGKPTRASRASRRSTTSRKRVGGDQRGEDKLSCLRAARAEKAKAVEAAKLAST